jgi:bifunctional polynucleotide phosphatase/kinase
MIGSVGSGKSTFVGNFLKDYVRINRDTLKTKEKCLSKAEEAIKENKFVVIDNTNPQQKDRKEFLDLAKKYSKHILNIPLEYPVRAFFMDVTKQLAMHNDNQRVSNKHRIHYS